MQIFIISDSHFGHLNMIPYCGRPKNFDDIIISNWNKVVQPTDLVIHLGDVIMGRDAETRLPSIMATLPGKKILVRGNHDVEKKWGTNMAFMQKGFDFVCDSFVYDKYAFSHCPMTPLPHQSNLNWQKEVELCMHGHFHNRQVTKGDLGRDLYDANYYLANQSKYKLVQIEDTLSPLLLETIIESNAKIMSRL